MFQVQCSAIDLRDVGQHGSRGVTVLLDQSGEIAEQVLFVEVPERGHVHHEADATTGVQNPRPRP